mmetsp:Transcript_775/g.2336  ORF Transcript_775/g.2336 Transcript_775/m.2336 type:complete len:485 (+) Transcript_775:19-1473(+)
MLALRPLRASALGHHTYTPLTYTSALDRHASMSPMKPALARAIGTEACRNTIRDRQPKPELGGARVTYRGGIQRTLGRSLVGRLLGRWRGTSIDLNYDYRLWYRHREASRHIRYWGGAVFYSQTLRRLLFPDLALVASISSAVIAYNSTHPEAVLALPTEPFALSGFALGLLVTFRTQTCHARYMTARNLWGDTVNVTRDIVSRALSTLPADMEMERAERDRVAMLASTFHRSLKYHLTVDGCNEHIDIRGCTPSEIQGAKDEALAVELGLVWHHVDPATGRSRHPFVERLLQPDVDNRPLYVLHELGRIFATARSSGKVGPVEIAVLDDRLLALMRVLGGCERLLRTPVYTPYTHHQSRFLLLWCASLPAAMYSVVGAMGTLPASVVVAYMMLGIEDIGSRIEMPFDTLPLWQYCDGLDVSIAQICDHDRMYSGSMQTPRSLSMLADKPPAVGAEFADEASRGQAGEKDARLLEGFFRSKTTP